MFVYYVFSKLAIALDVVLSYFWSVVQSLDPKSKKESKTGLFPKLCQINPAISTTKQCSLDGNGSQLVPYTNPRGEIEWFLQSQQPYQSYQQPQQPQQQQVQDFFPSPVSETTTTSYVSPEMNAGSVAADMLSISPISSNSEELSDYQTADKKFECPYCQTKFKIRGYLTRHIKKHSTAKAFHCPFYDPESAQKCHSTGGFSRRDTYKTHLKSRHFKYPPGKKGCKTRLNGWCGLCGEEFQNSEIWVELHIENRKCPQLPADFVNRTPIEKKKKKTGKQSPLLDVLKKESSEEPSESAVSSPAPVVKPRTHEEEADDDDDYAPLDNESNFMISRVYPPVFGFPPIQPHQCVDFGY